MPLPSWAWTSAGRHGPQSPRKIWLGVAGLAVVLALLRSVIPMPAVAAIRDIPGFALLSLCGLVGGYVSYTLRTRAVREKRPHGGVAWLLPAGLVLLPIVSFMLRLLVELGERIRDVMVAADGSVYALTDGVDGKLLRLMPEETL